MLIDLESWYELATQGAGQLRWRLAAEERGDWRCPSFDAAFLLTLGQRQTTSEFAFVGSLGHDAGGSGKCKLFCVLEAFLCHIL